MEPISQKQYAFGYGYQSMGTKNGRELLAYFLCFLELVITLLIFTVGWMWSVIDTFGFISLIVNQVTDKARTAGCKLGRGRLAD